MTANYVYYDDDRVHTVTYGNDASIEYLYDNARRLTSIKHLNAVGAVILRQDYGYDDRDLPTSISESDATGVVATTWFEHDARGRLYYENRSGQNPYKFNYTYDLGGNRLTKVDDWSLRTTVYHYDIEDPCRYESNNNRLEYFEVIDTAAEPDALVSTTYYYYTKKGNVERVVTETPPPSPGGIVSYSAVRMGYAHNGQALTHVIGESWRVDPELPACPMQSWEVQYVREFHYDGARQRYAVIEHDPTVYMNTLSFSPISRKWTDYDGNEPYGDFTVTNAGNPSTLANVRSFEPGMAKVDPFTTTHSGNTAYYHGDMIGTTRDLSGANGNGSSPSVHSAFGERISGSVPTDGTRYNYAGAWGYQEQADFPFLHVGHRYYNPSTGRFIQRDPIGISGGLNVYEYVGNNPAAFVDGLGLWRVPPGAGTGAPPRPPITSGPPSAPDGPSPYHLPPTKSLSRAGAQAICNILSINLPPEIPPSKPNLPNQTAELHKGFPPNTLPPTPSPPALTPVPEVVVVGATTGGVPVIVLRDPRL